MTVNSKYTADGTTEIQTVFKLEQLVKLKIR